MEYKPFVVWRHEDHDAVVPDPRTDAERRINEVVPLVTWHAARFLRQLNPARRAGLDITDLLQVAWVALLRADHRYQPREGGSYAAWATRIVRRAFSNLRRRLPGRPAAPFLRGTPRPAPAAELEPADHRELSPPEAVATKDDVQAAREAVEGAMERIESDRRFLMIAWTYGIAGRDPKPMGEIAGLLMVTSGQALHIRDQAETELRHILQSSGRLDPEATKPSRPRCLKARGNQLLADGRLVEWSRQSAMACGGSRP